MDPQSQAALERDMRTLKRKLRIAAERERLAGHSTCKRRHRHYRANCCPRCTELWAGLPVDAPSIPFGAFSDHSRANYSEKTWAFVESVEADLDEYLANWSPESCRHDLCAITQDNHEICERCGRDVTEPDFPVEQVEIARERLADYDARTAANKGYTEDRTRKEGPED